MPGKRSRSATWTVSRRDGTPLATLHGACVRAAKLAARGIAEAIDAPVDLKRARGPVNPVPVMAAGSLRTVKSGTARVLVGCPKGHYHPRARGRRKCDVGMRAVEVKRNAQGARGALRGRKNPGASAVAAARRTFRRWHGFESHGIVRVAGHTRLPRVLVKLGEVPEIVYISDKWGGTPHTYVHQTSRPRPLLATGPDGKGLFLIGGRVKATDRGLVH